MPEVVALPDTDERVGRIEQRQCLGGESVVAPVMRHLQHLDRVEPVVVRSAFKGLTLRVSTEHRIKASPLDSEDHARVVGPQLAEALGRRPDHGDPRTADPPGVTRAQTAELTIPCRATGRRVEPPEVRAIDRRIAGPPDLRDLTERASAARVVVMRVREHQSVDASDAVPGKRPVERHVVGTRVNEHRAPPITKQDRVSLPHVEHGERSADRARRAESGEHREGHRAGDDRRCDPP